MENFEEILRKDLHIERFYLNRADNEYPMTVRVMLRLIDKVDEQMLHDALKATRQRYPYLCVKLGIVRDTEGSEHFVYDDNPQPWVLSKGRQPVCLFSEEARCGWHQSLTIVILEGNKCIE